jgi:hypothetical protein
MLIRKLFKFENKPWCSRSDVSLENAHDEVVIRY